jgi:hypothetical protein
MIRRMRIERTLFGYLAGAEVESDEWASRGQDPFGEGNGSFVF